MLSSQQQQNLINLIDFEVENYLCETVPKYQSFDNMHVKHSDKEEIRILVDLVLLNAYVLTNVRCKVLKCWFNVLRKDSVFYMHKHGTLTGVYYLKNCLNNGTIVQFNGESRQLPCTDNSFQFISGKVYHKIPPYSGFDRYTVAFDLTEA